MIKLLHFINASGTNTNPISTFKKNLESLKTTNLSPVDNEGTPINHSIPTGSENNFSFSKVSLESEDHLKDFQYCNVVLDNKDQLHNLSQFTANVNNAIKEYQDILLDSTQLTTKDEIKAWCTSHEALLQEIGRNLARIRMYSHDRVKFFQGKIIKLLSNVNINPTTKSLILKARDELMQIDAFCTLQKLENHFLELQTNKRKKIDRQIITNVMKAAKAEKEKIKAELGTKKNEKYSIEFKVPEKKSITIYGNEFQYQNFAFEKRPLIKFDMNSEVNSVLTIENITTELRKAGKVAAELQNRKKTLQNLLGEQVKYFTQLIKYKNNDSSPQKKSKRTDQTLELCLFIKQLIKLNKDATIYLQVCKDNYDIKKMLRNKQIAESPTKQGNDIKSLIKACEETSTLALNELVEEAYNNGKLLKSNLLPEWEMPNTFSISEIVEIESANYSRSADDLVCNIQNKNVSFEFANVIDKFSINNELVTQSETKSHVHDQSILLEKRESFDAEIEYKNDQETADKSAVIGTVGGITIGLLVGTQALTKTIKRNSAIEEEHSEESSN